MKNKLIKSLLVICIVSLAALSGCGDSKASESEAADSFDKEDMASAWDEDEDFDEDEDKDKDNGKDNGKGGDEVVEKSYTEKEILELAKTLSGAPNAELDGVDPDGTYNIHLYGKNSQDTWDWYFIDPKSLEGTNVLGDKIDLKGAIQQ